jgi:hypothetical protein
VLDVDKELLLIIDDEADAWPEAPHNVIPTKRYWPYGSAPPNTSYLYHNKLRNNPFADPGQAFVEPATGIQLRDLAEAVTIAYLSYVSNSARNTAVGEFLSHRRSVLNGHDIWFGSYAAKVETEIYSADKLATMRMLAQELGCRERDTGMQILEQGDEGPGEVTSTWLIDTYFALKN